MKYIIEFENKIYMDDDGKEWYKVVNHPYWLVSKDMVGKLTPYAELKDENEKEKEDQIHIGDEVKFKDNSKAVVTFIMPGTDRYFVMWEDGLTAHFSSSEIQKTGRHFDTFDKLLGEMNKNE